MFKFNFPKNGAFEYDKFAISFLTRYNRAVDLKRNLERKGNTVEELKEKNEQILKDQLLYNDMSESLNRLFKYINV